MALAQMYTNQPMMIRGQKKKRLGDRYNEKYVQE
jgi:hypothetical protein